MLTQRLLDKKEPQKESPKKSDCFLQSTRVITGLIGAGAGFLYWTPSGVCVESATCGKRLVDFLETSVSFSSSDASDTTRWMLFLSGAIGYSGTNVYLSSQFYDHFSDFIGKQKSLAAKIGKGTFVVLYGVGQTTQVFLAALGSGGNPLGLTTLITVSGALPGHLFGAVGIAKNTLPQVYNHISQFILENCYYPCRTPKTAAEIIDRERFKHYSREQKLFLKRAEMKLKFLIVQAREVEEVDEDPLTFLFAQEGEVSEKSTIEKIMDGIVKVLAIELAVNSGYVGILNAYHLMKSFFPNDGLRVAITALLCSSHTYNALKITVPGVESGYTHLKNIMMGKPIDSMAFQLHRKTMIGAATFCTLISILSYAVVNVIWDKNYDGFAKDELRYGARVGIDIHHAYALTLFCIDLLSKWTRNPTSQKLFAIEKKVTQLKAQSVNEFSLFAESLDPQKKIEYGIREFKEEKKPEPKPKPRRSWCSWFSFGARYNKEEEELAENIQLSQV